MALENADVVNEGLEEVAKEKMQGISARLAGLPQQAMIERAGEVWPAVEEAVQRHHIDLIVLGTQGRSGINKLLLGSVAEAVFRQPTVAVLTVGPSAKSRGGGAGFDCVLFAADLTSGSSAGFAYATLIVRENKARFVLLHVIRHLKEGEMFGGSSETEGIRQLREIASSGSNLSLDPEVTVACGDPADRIVETAEQRDADLIVLGLYRAELIPVATHFARGTAQQVAARARCPVVTVRG